MNRPNGVKTNRRLRREPVCRTARRKTVSLHSRPKLGIRLTHEHKLNGNAQVNPPLSGDPVFIFQYIDNSVANLIANPDRS